MVRSPGAQLLGRQPERDVLRRLLEAARGGHGGVLVVHGEPGVGKTALLEDAVQAARAFRVARTVGVEGEMELAYAALQQLCAPILELTELAHQMMVEHHAQIAKMTAWKRAWSKAHASHPDPTAPDHPRADGR
jgi:predicted ATP-dependent serine protease